MALDSKDEKALDKLLDGYDAGKIFDVMQKLNDEAQKIKMHISRNMKKYKNCKGSTFLKETDIDSIVSQCKTSLKVAKKNNCESIFYGCLCIIPFLDYLKRVGEGRKEFNQQPDTKDYHCYLVDIRTLLEYCGLIQEVYKYMAEKLKK